MVQYSVFDVAQHLISRTDRQEIGALKLQKLCFYAFGWYSYQTGDSLFSDHFYAMKLGPVVSELLSAHAGQRSLTLGELKPQFEVRETSPTQLDPYTSAVVDAVWDHYGKFSAGQLVDMTHDEKVWIDAWRERPEQSQRGDMPQQDIIDHFFFRQAVVPSELQLPDARVGVEGASFLTSLETHGTATPPTYFEDLQRFLVGAASH